MVDVRVERRGCKVSRQRREYNVWFSFIQDQVGKRRTEFEMNVPPQSKLECIVRTTIFLPERPCNLLPTSLPRFHQTVAKRSEEFANSRVMLSNYNTTLSGVDLQNRDCFPGTNDDEVAVRILVWGLMMGVPIH